MRASPRWLEYSNTYYLFRWALPHAERRVLSRSPSTPKSDVSDPRSRTGSDLTGSCCRSSLSVSIRAPAQGATVARESILIPMNPRSRTGATAVVEMDASMAAFCGVGGRCLDIHDQKLLLPPRVTFQSCCPCRMSCSEVKGRTPPRVKPKSGAFSAPDQSA
jgi:hypothetical protein